MKYVISIICLIITLLPLKAQDKVVESSAKKAPSWIGIADGEFFTVSAQGETLNSVQQKCMEDIKQRIITSIAANITSVESSSATQSSSNNAIKLLEEYSSSVQTFAANLPFLTGISISKAEDIYWVKYYVKKENRYYYDYHIKYPFPSHERESLVNEFLQLDNRMYGNYLTLKENFDKFTQIEYIEQAINDADALLAYFFDSARRGEVKALQSNYRKLYHAISVVPMGEALGEYNYKLVLNGRNVVCSSMPTLRSKTATDLSVRREEKSYCITYNYENCMDGEENKVELIYMFGGKAIRHQILFDVTENKMMVIPYGEVSIRRQQGGAEVSMTLRSKYDNEFTIEEVAINIPQVEGEIKSGILNSVYSGKGLHILTFKVDSVIINSDKIGESLTKGYIKIKNNKTKKSHNNSLQLPYTIN